VELAQLTYLLPRLIGQWRHLERLGGGIGTRGPGETQLESDRRVVRRRIAQIHTALRDVQRHRRLLREHRRDVGLPVAALVGYTNAGKTTLLNRLAGAEAPTADQLFVTLDPAARLVTAPGRGRFILTDTVGFIQKLPPQLIAAFKATLEELDQADLLVHVADVSHPRAPEQMAAVHAVLEELALLDKPILTVLNKIDRLGSEDGLRRQLASEGGIEISALRGEGIGTLLGCLGGALHGRRVVRRILVPFARTSILGPVYARGHVLRREDRSDGVFLEVEVPPTLTGLVAPFRAETSEVEGDDEVGAPAELGAALSG
jgi:GTP-binding protein HflX